MKLLPIGFGNYLTPSHIISILSPDSAPIKRLVQEGRENGKLIDASFGRSTKSVIVTDSGNIILSALTPEALSVKFPDDNKEGDESNA